jgi:hypothetical protein
LIGAVKSSRSYCLFSLQPGTELYDVLRLRVQNINFNDGEYVDTDDVISMARSLNAVIAIIDTRRPELGFLYHYIDNTWLLSVYQ